MYEEHYIVTIVEGSDVVDHHHYDLNQARTSFIRMANMVFEKISDNVSIQYTFSRQNFRGNVDFPWWLKIGNIEVTLMANIKKGADLPVPRVPQEYPVYYDGGDNALLGYTYAPLIQSRPTTFVHLPLLDDPDQRSSVTSLCARMAPDPDTDDQALFITYVPLLRRLASFRRPGSAPDDLGRLE